MENKIKITNKCQKSSSCRVFCPENAFFTINNNLYVDPYKCTTCGICLDVCPNHAIEKELTP